jgi:hypothetical protein
MNKAFFVLSLIVCVFLVGCGREKGGMACDWIEIEGVKKEICIYNENK